MLNLAPGSFRIKDAHLEDLAVLQIPSVERPDGAVCQASV
jgi:hypothetical protein